MIRVPLQVHARLSISALGPVEPEGPTDDLCVALYINDQEAAELSLKTLVDDHLSSVVPKANPASTVSASACVYVAAPWPIVSQGAGPGAATEITVNHLP